MQAESSNSYSEDVNIGVDLRAKSGVTAILDCFLKTLTISVIFKKIILHTARKILRNIGRFVISVHFGRYILEAIQTNTSLAYMNSLETNQYAVSKDA